MAGSVDLEDVLQRVARIAEDVAGPEAEAADREPRWAEATIRALQKEGIGGLVVPAENGGMGLGLHAVTRVTEALGRWSPSAGIAFGMHLVGAAVLAARATVDQRERYLRPIAEGRHLTTIGLSEPGTGAVFYIPETTMRRDGEGYVLNGTKSFVTNGSHADSYVCSADAGGTSGAGHFSCIAVDAGTDGVTWGPAWAGMGMRGNDARSMMIEDARVPVANRLGHEGDEVWYVFRVIAPYFLSAMAGTYMGLAERALDEALVAVGERRSGGLVHVERLDVFHHELGRTWARQRAARAYLHEATRLADRGDPMSIALLASAKADVTRAAVDVANDCMTLAGGRAYAQGSVLGRLLRDARAGPVMAPTDEALFTWAGRAVLGEPLLGA